ncbi:MAG: hypothetical protein FDZ75_07405 [Actinobacteria bacterium]|nr:MAG: hypothetical protein FDZ75_07405 [Actinomycetota bacterium]
MTRRVFALVFAATLLAAVLPIVGCTGGGSAPSATGSASALDGKALVEAKCTQCHGLDRVAGQTGDRALWEQTVGQMEARGLAVTQEEKTAILDYLAATYK